ncbi:chitin-binding type-2 domain-containing protein [Caerostris extrusa]|uniref:Chitin-binding type-2 domain-containing protein n=1 Tax=Caerostris extrusa TaxID=172846 RepID=A0AAV4UYF4_CAEEX|nr:chitin-binding type-2 domain-containing protein [Caerostris extrusa]
MSNALNFFSVFIGCIEFTLSKGDGNQQNWPRNQQGWNSGGGQTKGGPLGGWDDEPSNPWGGGGGGWKLEDSIPGIPGQSYPNFDKIPDTSFDCRRQKNPGYYGDVESQCQWGSKKKRTISLLGDIPSKSTIRTEVLSDLQVSQYHGKNVPTCIIIQMCSTFAKLVEDRIRSFVLLEPSSTKRASCVIGGSTSTVVKVQFITTEMETYSEVLTSALMVLKLREKANKEIRKVQTKHLQSGFQPGVLKEQTATGGMKGSMNQGGQQGSWGIKVVPIKVQLGQRRPNANAAGGRGGRNKGAARGNSGRNNWQNGGNQGGQKGTAMGGNTNAGWGQQGNSPGRNKGVANNQMRQSRDGNFGQKGGFSGGNNKIQRRSGLSPNNRIGRGDQKGQSNTNTIPNNKGGKGNFGMGNQGLIDNQGGSKGFDGRTDKNHNTNGWSMGQQNFQFSFHEKSEAFSGNSNTENEPSFQDNSWQGPSVNENFQPDRNFKGEFGNNNWNNAGGDLNQWGNRIGEFQPEFVNNNADGHDNWKADYDVPNTNSFHLNDKGSFEGQAGENDYDYAWNS